MLCLVVCLCISRPQTFYWVGWKKLLPGWVTHGLHSTLLKLVPSRMEFELDCNLATVSPTCRASHFRAKLVAPLGRLQDFSLRTEVRGQRNGDLFISVITHQLPHSLRHHKLLSPSLVNCCFFSSFESIFRIHCMHNMVSNTITWHKETITS